MTVKDVSGYKSSEAFKQIHSSFSSLGDAEAKKVVSQVKGIFEFHIKDKSGKVEKWSVDLKSDKPEVKNGAPTKKPDVTITVDDDLFAQLFEGKANAQKSFMQGKLKVKGQMLLATKLDNVFKQVRGSAKL